MLVPFARKGRMTMAHVAEATSSVTFRARSNDGPSVVQIDRYVGDRLRERRVMLGITQQRMAELLGVSYQQAHKYEKGINRISAGRLHQISSVLGVEINYFFDGLNDGEEKHKMTSKRLFLELSRTICNIDNEAYLEAISTLARTLATHRS
jgi:transcriptional regulator with XRE-family HTH domain